MTQPVDPNSADDSMNLIEVLFIIWRGKWLVLVVTLLFLSLATYYCMKAKNWYKADVVLKPMDSSREGLSNQANALSGLASLAGLSMGSSPSAEPIAVLQSRELTADFIKDLNLLPVLFPKLWDPNTHAWKTTVKTPPDLRDGISFFAHNVRTVVEDKKSGMTILNVEWTDPQTAMLWANELVDRVNDRMRQRALTEAQTNVTYLKEQLGMATVVTLQQSIGRVLENELQKLLLAKANNEYAFRIIDHAQVPKSPSSPQKVLIIGGSIFGGLFLSSVFLMFRHVINLHKVGRTPP